VAAGDEEGLAGDPARILGGKKDCDGTDVVGLTDAAQRRLRFHGFLKIRSGDAGGMKTFRLDHTGVQRIHPDPARPEFFRERTGDGIDRCFRGGVDGPAGLRAHGCDGTDVDDASAVRAEGFGCFLRDEEKAEHVEIELPMEVFLGHFGQRFKVKNPGVIDENIDAAEGGYGFGEKAIDIGFLRDVRLHGDGFAALAGDVGDDAIRAFFARGIIDDDGSTGVTKVCRNGCADTFRCAGDDGDFTAEFL